MTAWGAIRIASGILAVTLGTVLMVLAIPSAVTASAIESSVGRSGVVVRPLGELGAAPGDRAVIVDGVAGRLVAPTVPPWVNDALEFGGTTIQELAEDLGDVVLVATMATDSPGFLGVAPVDTVNAYLDGVPYSVAVRPDEGSVNAWPTVSVPGSGVPDDPEGLALWTASSTGTSPELDAGSLESSTLVLMRRDASTGPRASLRLEYRVPGAERTLEASAVTAASASVGGLALILLGGWAIVGRRRPQ